MGGLGKPQNLDDFVAVSCENFASWPTEFDKIFRGKLWALIIRV